MGKPRTSLEIAKSAYVSWMLATGGCWLGGCLWRWWDYTARPGLYAMTSAPWWVGPVVYTAAFLLESAAVTALYWVVRRWLKKRSLR